jgi:hypothetical protein
MEEIIKQWIHCEHGRKVERYRFGSSISIYDDIMDAMERAWGTFVGLHHS